MNSRSPLRSPAPQGVSQVPDVSFGACRPLLPREARRVHMPVTSPPVPGFIILGSLAASSWCNEATGFACATAHAFAFRGFVRPDYSGSRPIGYMVNGQFTWRPPFRPQEKPDFT